jgi:hypothetical protein
MAVSAVWKLVRLPALYTLGQRAQRSTQARRPVLLSQNPKAIAFGIKLISAAKKTLSLTQKNWRKSHDFLQLDFAICPEDRGRVISFSWLPLF